jgi:Tfp pilus assembly protein PilN
MAGLNEINLVPTDIVEEHLIRQRIRRGILCLIILVGCLFLIGIYYSVSVKRLERKVAGLRSQGRHVKRLENELHVCLQGTKQLLARRKILRDLTGRYCFTSMVAGLAQAMNPETKLNKLCVEKSLGSKEQEDTTHGRQKGADIAYELRLGGVSKSYQTLSVFLSNLQNDRAFQGVILARSDVDEKRKSAVLFEISLRYEGTKERMK